MLSAESVIPANPTYSLKSSSSLASSSATANFRPLERELHDASKRFVENMPDSRITFYSNVAAFEKRVRSKQQGYLTDATGRVGYLLLQPKRPVIWIDEQHKTAFRIPMRVTSKVYEQSSVFIACFNKSEGILTLDDCWQFKGERLTGKSFNQRWEYILKFFTHDYIHDPVLQRGLRVQPAHYFPLAQFQQFYLARSARVEWIHWQPEDAGQKRLRIQLTEQLATVKEDKKLQTKVKVTADAMSKGYLVARAVPHEDLPDTYTLYTADSIEKGTAAVQKYSLSVKLNTAKKEKKEVVVRVSWSKEFSKWQILEIASTEDSVTHSEEWNVEASSGSTIEE